MHTNSAASGRPQQATNTGAHKKTSPTFLPNEIKQKSKIVATESFCFFINRQMNTANTIRSRSVSVHDIAAMLLRYG